MNVVLTPPPRRLERLDGALRLAAAALLPASGDPGYEPAVGRLAEGLADVGRPARRAEPGSLPRPTEAPLRLRLDPSAAADRADEGEGYRLEIGPGGVDIIAAAGPGLYYGAETLLQWLAAHPAAERETPPMLPAVRIEDRPGFRHRGLLLDISRNRVPTFDSLLGLVDTMAALKLNQLQLYTEHTFAYRGHEIVWRDASPLTGAEVRALDAHCRRRCVELVPNQNSFGHMHRWLRHEPYRRLAEVPEGMPHPFFDISEPFSLCPVDPGSIELLGDLYDQLLPQFTSSMFNVNCDETFDLGKGRSAAACRERGTQRVYLEFLRRLHALAAERGRRIQFWGDILAGRPDLLHEVPSDAVALDWGYEAGHPFAERAAALADTGLEFYLCPGTSSWNSFAGRVDNAVANLAEAARAGAEHGASGYLITDWGDFGHLQPAPVSWPGLVAGAIFAWSPATADKPEALPLATLVDRHGACGLAAGTGEVLVALGNAYLEAGVPMRNTTALFKLVIFAHRSLAGAGLAGLDAAALERTDAMVADAAERVAALPETGASARLVRHELAWVAGMLRFACRLGGARLTSGGHESVTAVPGDERRALAGQLDPLIEELPGLWNARSRPGGMKDSRDRLTKVRQLLS